MLIQTWFIKKKGPKELIILKYLLKSIHDIFLKEGSGWQRLNETLQTFSQVTKAISSKRLPFKKTTKRWGFFNECSRSLMNLWQYIKQIKKIMYHKRKVTSVVIGEISLPVNEISALRSVLIYIHIGTLFSYKKSVTSFSVYRRISLKHKHVSKGEYVSKIK